mgnify:FL=1
MIIVRGVLTALPILLRVGRILKCPCLSDTLYSINIPAALIVDEEVQPERSDKVMKDYSLILTPNVRKNIVAGIRSNAAIQFGKIIAHSSQSIPSNDVPIIVEILYTEKRAIYNVTYATIDNKLKRKAHKPSMKPVGDCFFRGSHPNFFSVLELECQPIPMYHHAVDHIKPEPFVAATLSAFTVSRQRWDCDIPTVTLALPSATFDQSVFLSPYPYCNFKSAFGQFCKKRLKQTVFTSLHHYYGLTWASWQSRTQKMDKTFALPNLHKQSPHLYSILIRRKCPLSALKISGCII